MNNKVDMVNKPPHYVSPYPITFNVNDILETEDPGAGERQVHIQVKDVVKAWGMEYNAWLFNVLKYMLRAGRKTEDALQDMKKARYYLNEEIARLEKLQTD